MYASGHTLQGNDRLTEIVNDNHKLMCENPVIQFKQTVLMCS